MTPQQESQAAHPDAARRLTAVRGEIEKAAAACQRRPEDVALLAVSKGHPTLALAEMAALGVRDFGENYVQELISKAADTTLPADVRWHFIGHLQTNKVKVALPHLFALHSLDRPSLLDALEKHAALLKGPLELYVQCEVDAADANKQGAGPGDAHALCARLGEHLRRRAQGAEDASSRLVWVGFMGMGPADADDTRLRALYDRFHADALALWQEHHPVAARTRPRFSLGMSSDLGVAVAAGSTLVRVGTALFGRRLKPQPGT